MTGRPGGREREATMEYQPYQESEQRVGEKLLDRILAELDLNGYSVVEAVLEDGRAADLGKRLDAVWETQLAETGEEGMRQFREWGICRALVHYDFEFASLVRHPLASEVLSHTVGETAILHLCNGIIVFSDVPSHQAQLHRDFAKPFASDRPLSINAFWILDDFRPETGATWFVPHTHRLPTRPSPDHVSRHAVQLRAPAGAVVFFDSRIYHRGGENTSGRPRRALNFQYTMPFIKQQIDLTRLMKAKVDPASDLAQTLGMWSVAPETVSAFRVPPEERTYRPGQG